MMRVALWLMLAGPALFAQASNPDALAQAQLGLEAAQKARYGEAIEAYGRAIALDPNLPGIYTCSNVASGTIAYCSKPKTKIALPAAMATCCRPSLMYVIGFA